MEIYVGVVDIAEKIFTWHWSMIGYGIAFILIALLFTRFWKYSWEIALIIDGIGWLCAFYAGLTGNWFIGWFAWVIPLSATLFLRGLIQHIENLPYVPDKGKE